ncbi:MAG: BACON domain-containing carbohydrate-binding protein [Candidatus Cryptobacteroides sp.]|nr:BACON domain-containing carbohydrate-binding protein [Candidatus Cryptobacteroides sp.]
MKLINKIFSISAALVCVSLAGCQEEEMVKPSALLCDPSLTFAAKDAEPQTLTVASDEEWMIDVPVDWIDVDPVRGSNTVEVTVSVADNYENGVMSLPREATITIANKRGYSVTAVIYQKGDNYIGVSEMTVADFKKIDDGAFAKIPDGQVMAVAAEGFVISDASGALYVDSKEKVAVGDKVFIAGEKVAKYGTSAIKAGEVTVNSNEEVVYPSPVPIDPSTLNVPAYVTAESGILGSSLVFDPALSVSVAAVELKSGSVNLEAVNMHNIAYQGYLLGVENGTASILIISLEDKGINENLEAYFYDDFSWMKSFIEASGVDVGDSIGENNAGASAPNLRSNASLSLLLDELLARGYEDLNPGPKVIYPQAYYWKFGKTSSATSNNNNGLRLPEIAFKGSEPVNAVIEFDWAAHMTGSGNIDNVQIVVEVPEGAGLFENGSNVSDPLITTQENGHLEWQHATVLLKGATNKSRISIRPYQYESVTPDQQRWHLDNIKIKDSGVPYADPVYAKLTLSDEIVTFEGTPEGPATITVKSDNPWTITKAYGADWFSIDVLEGNANEDVAVTVNCEQSLSTTLRTGYFTIASADTRKNIYVVQSAAGGELDPLISVVTDKSTSALLGEGDSFDVAVQANIEYAVEISDEWITEVEAPSTRALVEKTVHSFTLAANLTGATRSGYIRFYNEDKNIEAYVMIKQDNFEPRIDVIVSSQTRFIPAAGMTLPVRIESNVDFTATSDEITLPVSEAVAGNYDLSVQVKANTGLTRDAKVTFYNAKYDFTYVYAIEQHGSDVIFADDFSWVQPVVDAAKSSDPGEYDTVGSKNLSAKAPNLYSTEALNDIFVPLRDKIGYVIPGKADGANNVVYVQECYLKMGKTKSSSQTSLTLPSINAGGKDYVLSMDWARMVQGDGTIDNYTLTWVIVGNGTFENGTKYSDPFETPQGLGEIFWTKISAVVKGADADTRITVVATDLLNKETGAINYKASGGRRMFIDNIVAKVIE